MSTTKSMLPHQAAPIDRTPAGAAAFADSAGVDASGFWDVLGDVAKTVAPVALPALASLV
jgi:hypothetical protein